MATVPKPDGAFEVQAGASTFRLVVAYDGTDYSGWQVQPGKPTIQGKLADAVYEVVGERVLPQGSGRTDTGVHAEGQVVSLTVQAAIPPERLHRALNRRLPPAIRVVALDRALPEFHARANVLNKTYEYRIFERGVESGFAEHGLLERGVERGFAAYADELVCPPAVARYAWDCRWPLQLEPMQAVAQALVGTHDFSSFAASDPDRAKRMADVADAATNVRAIFCACWMREAGLLRFRITGSGFLHHMVRNIVGTCVDAGAGRLDPCATAGILAARDRGRAGATAPAQGLHLLQVVYAGDDGEGGVS